MLKKFKSIVCATALLLIWPGLAVTQEQQPPKSEPQPDAASPTQPAPEKAAPQATEPQGAEPQPEAPSPTKPDAAAPKDQTTPPPQEQPPATAPAAPQQPESAAKAKPQPTRTASSKKKATKKTAKKTSATHSGESQTEKPGTAQTGKVVVRNGGARDSSVQLSPVLTQEQESHNRENTDQLLATTDDNLKRVEGRPLTASQQSTIDQIRSYMRQAKLAADAGDLARAHTLAFKAHLLSDDLAKP
jgi:outer membrane biosynthesis protein TonB